MTRKKHTNRYQRNGAKKCINCERYTEYFLKKTYLNWTADRGFSYLFKFKILFEIEDFSVGFRVFAGLPDWAENTLFWSFKNYFLTYSVYKGCLVDKKPPF